MQKSRLSRFSRRPIDLSPGLLIGVQLCARSRDFEPLKRDVSVIITHAPFTTENSRFLFFFFRPPTSHPSSSHLSRYEWLCFRNDFDGLVNAIQASNVIEERVLSS